MSNQVMAEITEHARVEEASKAITDVMLDRFGANEMLYAIITLAATLAELLDADVRRFGSDGFREALAMIEAFSKRNRMGPIG
ncbi:MAG TPA: hypothetical protein VF814_03870 [Casimicrobiaceae bacterium]